MIAFAAGLAAALPAADAAATDEQTATEELKQLADPTLFKPHVWLDSQWKELKQGGADGKETLEGFWAWGRSPNQDWAVRLKVPFAWHVAGDTTGDSDEHGLGDIDLATGTAFRLGKSWRTAAGLELRAPTATGDLGDDVWRLKPIGNVAWDATERLTLAVTAEYNHSVAEQDGATPQRLLEVFFPATCLLPRRWAVTGQYEFKLDFQNDGRWTHSARLIVAKRLEAPLSLAASIKKPFVGGVEDLQVNFFVTWYFQ